jgi:hypothetical protein
MVLPWPSRPAAIGAGEVAVTVGLLHLARTAESEVARMAAYTTLSKMLGMQDEVVEGRKGITFVIQGPMQQPVEVGPPPVGQPAPVLPAPASPYPESPVPGPPIQITR